MITICVFRLLPKNNRKQHHYTENTEILSAAAKGDYAICEKTALPSSRHQSPLKAIRSVFWRSKPNELHESLISGVENSVRWCFHICSTYDPYQHLYRRKADKAVNKLAAAPTLRQQDFHAVEIKGSDEISSFPAASMQWDPAPGLYTKAKAIRI
jgi:hypothetical protein